MRFYRGGVLAAVCLILGFDGDIAQAAPPVGLQSDGKVMIAGRALRCGTARNVLDPALRNLGVAGPGVVAFNPHLLNRHSNTVQLFVFHHECGHHHVGRSEIGADCWAVKQGVRQGWLGPQGIDQICRSFGNSAATPTHPSSVVRCASLQRCFAGAAASAKRPNLAQPPGPKLMSLQPAGQPPTSWR
jgi:hypothetical protein